MAADKDTKSIKAQITTHQAIIEELGNKPQPSPAMAQKEIARREQEVKNLQAALDEKKKP